MDGRGGGMHIPDCLAAVGTWESVAEQGTQSWGKWGTIQRDDGQGREDPTPEGRVCLHGIIPGKMKSHLHPVMSPSPRNEPGFLSPPTKLSEHNHAHPLVNPN